jgi:hypothetical protein
LDWHKRPPYQQTKNHEKALAGEKKEREFTSALAPFSKRKRRETDL